MSKRFDENYNTGIKVNDGIKADLFSIAANMDPFEIKNSSLKYKVPLSIQDNNGNNLIHYTIKLNGSQTEIQRLNFIKYLYNENVNPDAPNKDNITPLLLACSKQYYNIIKYLIDIGVNINYVDNFDNNAYHYLFGSILKPYLGLKKKSILPIPTDYSSDKIVLMKTIRKNIFDKIKDDLSLKSIIDTIKVSISTNERALESVVNFQNEYNKLIVNVDNKDTLKIDLLYADFLNQFIKNIQRDWNNFPITNSIKLHKSTSSSIPQGDPSGLSVIENGNYRLALRNECNNIINDLNNNILNRNKNVKTENLNELYLKFLTDFITNNNIITKTGDEFNINTLNDRSISQNYNRLIFDPRTIHKNAVDHADNIIDYENNTFAGGSRQVEITNEFNKDMITDLFNKKNNIVVGSLAYTLYLNYTPLPPPPNVANNFTGTFNLLGDNIKDAIVDYIYSIAINKDIEEKETALKVLIKSTKYRYLIKLMDNKEKYNLGHYLYVFCCAVQGIEKIDKGPDNINLILNGDYGMRQGIVLLCSAIYHNQGDIIKSIYNVFKPNMINNIIDTKDETKKDEVYSDFIELLLYDSNINVIKNNNSNLEKIKELTKNYMNETPFTEDDKNKIKEYMKLTNKDIKGVIDCELLGLYIVSYYQKMQHKPLIQNLVDFLVLIRLFEINKNRENTNKLDNFVDRLKSLYLSPIDSASINAQLQDNTNNIQFTKLDDSKIDNYFKKLFNTANLQKMYEMISQYQIPSRINFYLSNDFNYLNSNDDERKLYFLKQIEANHFGLNFIGLMPVLNNINELSSGSGTNNVEMQLFNFNNTNNIRKNYTYFFFESKGYLFRPAINISYQNIIKQYLNNIYGLENRIFAKLSKILDQIKNNNDKLYSKAIGYYYPILNALENHEKFFSNLIEEKINDQFNINRFSARINRLNGLLFLFYYMDSKNSNINIPKFLYHQLGNNPIIIFDKEDKKLVYPDGDTNQVLSTVTDIKDYNDRKGSQAYISSLNYNNIIDKISNRQFFISRDIINENFVRSKNKSLPPSLVSVYNEFLRFNIFKIIENNFNITVDDKLIDFIKIKDYSDIQKKLIIATIMEEIIIDYIKNNIYTIGYNIFNTILKNKDINVDTIEKLFGPLDFTQRINTLESKDIELLKDSSSSRNYYKFSITPNLKEYKLYPNNYNSLNLNKNFYKIEIKDDITKLLINSGCNLFQINNDGNISIINLIKYKKIDSIKEIKNILRDFNIFNSDNYLSPHKYILSEYKLNLEAFNGKNYYDQINNFTETYIKDIINIIIANETLGNNIIENLKLSFYMCVYLTQQYLFESLYLHFDKDFTIDKLKEIFNIVGNSINYELNLNRLYLNDLVSDKTYNEDKYILLQKYKDMFESENTKLKNLSDNILDDGVFKTKLEDNKKKYNDKITQNNTNINSIDSIISTAFKLSSKTIDYEDFNLIGKYDNYLNNIGNERLVYLTLWNDLFKKSDKGEYDNLNNSYDNFIQKLFKYELENLNNINDNYILFNQFYGKLKINCVEYFNSKYLDNNETLNFVKNTLIHLTQNIICVGIETLIRRILLDYFDQFYSSELKTNIANINLIFDIIKDDLYNDVANKIVINNSDIFKDEYEEAGFMKETNNDLIDKLLDKLINTSPILLDDKIKYNLKSIIGYFETIIPKMITNWRIVIENMFLLIINHSNILECHSIFNN